MPSAQHAISLHRFADANALAVERQRANLTSGVETAGKGRCRRP
jgi:hypothetical protein